MSLHSDKPKIKVGQWVFVPIGRNRLKGKVEEDRGRLGVNGEHVFLVWFPQDESLEPSRREVSESRLTPAN
jgi:hypothetical protein